MSNNLHNLLQQGRSPVLRSREIMSWFKLAVFLIFLAAIFHWLSPGGSTTATSLSCSPRYLCWWLDEQHHEMFGLLLG